MLNIIAEWIKKDVVYTQQNVAEPQKKKKKKNETLPVVIRGEAGGGIREIGEGC